MSIRSELRANSDGPVRPQHSNWRNTVLEERAAGAHPTHLFLQQVATFEVGLHPRMVHDVRDFDFEDAERDDASDLSSDRQNLQKQELGCSRVRDKDREWSLRLTNFSMHPPRLFCEPIHPNKPIARHNRSTERMHYSTTQSLLHHSESFSC